MSALAEQNSKTETLPDLDKLPGTAACTTEQAARISGYANNTLRVWRGQGRGPKVTMIGGRPRYLVRDLREWMGLGA